MKQNKETLKQFFETGDKPTQQQYGDLIDSYVDAQQEAGEANRRFVIDEAGAVNVTSEQQIPNYQAGTNISIDSTNPLQPVISATGSSVTIQQGSYSPTFSGPNSTFSATVSSAEYYQIGDRVFVDIKLTGVNSDGNASGGYIQANIPFSAPYKATTGIVTNLLDYTVYSGAYIPDGYNQVRIKDTAIVNGSLAICFSYTTGGPQY
ncbi:hypothetical protein P8625_10845 [Tenacibaculum tangerinum]|uniref:DUF4815 domain-containing protein n=1 Tax=Tenacibaculum tangerinum TaxID=3038772 RepID=A0ABY8KZZ1_9FLAO|nr:hypothetical protein [Tenacibaculum tangerinum]WGH74586.1 hypothetical protein P8625_10845 [Tenacibaculum tangerinum]